MKTMCSCCQMACSKCGYQCTRTAKHRAKTVNKCVGIHTPAPLDCVVGDVDRHGVIHEKIYYHHQQQQQHMWQVRIGLFLMITESITTCHPSFLKWHWLLLHTTRIIGGLYIVTLSFWFTNIVYALNIIHCYCSKDSVTIILEFSTKPTLMCSPSCMK